MQNDGASGNKEPYSIDPDQEKTSRDGNESYYTFGIIADVQYADTADGYNFLKTRKRYYRNSLHLLETAVDVWNNEAKVPSFILQLGDIIDGVNAQLKNSGLALKRALAEVEKSKAPFHHVWGNHEFYNFSRDYLRESGLYSKSFEDQTVLVSRKIPKHISEDSGPDGFYAYHFSPFPTFRFLLTDCYDLSIIGRTENSKKYQISMQILKQKNPNTDLNSPVGLSERQFVQYNGGFSKDQLYWVDEVLNFSDENSERVVVVGHLPVHPECTDSACLAWNYAELLSLLQSHKCVVCYISGHDHDGGYFLDGCGIHHITLQGIIETPPGSHAFGTVHVYDDKMTLTGRGSVPDRVMHFKKIKCSVK